MQDFELVGSPAAATAAAAATLVQPSASSPPFPRQAPAPHLHPAQIMNTNVDNKENADPCQQKNGGLGGRNNYNVNITSSPHSPGAAKHKRTQTEQKEQRPPLRDITGQPGLTPTFAQPAFDIASDSHQQQQQLPQGAPTSARKKKPAGKTGGGTPVEEEDPSKKGGKKNGGSGSSSSSSKKTSTGMMTGSTSMLRPLR